MLTVYCWLLRLYPRTYRHHFGEEMTFVFRDARSSLSPALAGKLRFYRREFCGLLSGALRARFDRLFVPAVPFRRSYMQPQFRFPRFTIFLMWVILAGVLLAIAEAKTIRLPYGPGRTLAVWSALPWFIVSSIFLVCVTVAVGWGIFFALRRTGLQRLERLDTASNS
jgi:hypothetical protein